MSHQNENPKILLSSVHEPVHGNTILNVDLNIYLDSVDKTKELSPEQTENIKRTVQLVFEQFKKVQQKPKQRRVKKK